jgi:two-component system response regulator AtoC
MFELADGGTILLDEIGDMDYKLQAKLLQVLQDHEFQRLGGKETTRVNVRVICATHNDLQKAVAQGTFRQDLYYRLNVITFHMPPLRERKEDIVPMAEHLLQRHTTSGQSVPELTPLLRHALLTYDWPGNVRELENVVRRLLVLGAQESIAEELRSASSGKNAVAAPPTAQPEPTAQAAPPITALEQLNKAKHQAEIETILSALNSTHWNRKQAAALLKIDYKALLYKIKKLGLDAPVAG